MTSNQDQTKTSYYTRRKFKQHALSLGGRAAVTRDGSIVFAAGWFARAQKAALRVSGVSNLPCHGARRLYGKHAGGAGVRKAALGVNRPTRSAEKRMRREGRQHPLFLSHPACLPPRCLTLPSPRATSPTGTTRRCGQQPASASPLVGIAGIQPGIAITFCPTPVPLACSTYRHRTHGCCRAAPDELPLGQPASHCAASVMASLAPPLRIGK